MRRFLIAIAVIGILFVIGTSLSAHQTSIKKCIPFAIKEVPDEASSYPVKWVFYGKFILSPFDKYKNGRKVWFKTVRYYQDDTGLHLGVYEFLGKLAFKAWACDVGMDPVTRDKPDHMVAVLKNGKWYIANVQSPEISKIYGKGGLLSSVKITLLDKDGKVIVERVISR